MSRAADLPRAADMAARVLLRFRPAALPVDPLSILQACRNTHVYSLAAAADALTLSPGELEARLGDAEAVTLCSALGDSFHYIVVYRRDGHPARLRFTLAHELGHRLLGHTGHDPADEQEADCFASHLLCPEPVLGALAGDGGAKAAECIATACYISYTCARVALNRPALPVDPDRAAALTELFAPALKSLKTHLPKAE